MRTLRDRGTAHVRGRFRLRLDTKEAAGPGLRSRLRGGHVRGSRDEREAAAVSYQCDLLKRHHLQPIKALTFSGSKESRSCGGVSMKRFSFINAFWPHHCIEALVAVIITAS